MLRHRRIRIAWIAAAFVTGVGWGALGYIVEGLPGLLTAAGISIAAISGIATLAHD